MSAPRSGILPRPIWRISLRIWSNCLTSWLTCWTLVPEPFAMRSRREPLMSSGRRRSSAVIDRMIASTRPLCRTRQDDRPDAFYLALVDLHLRQLLARQAGQHAEDRLQRAHLAQGLELLEEVLERELVAAQLALELERLVPLELLLGLLDERHHVAHAQDPLRHPLGVEALELVELLAHAGEQDRLAGDG